MRQSTSPPQTTLSERVREAMHAAGMTQAELARRVGIAQPSVNDWLSGKTKRLKLETAVRAAAVLGVRLEWLVWGRGRPREDDHEHDHPSADEGSNGVTIHAALPVVLDAIAACPHRDELRTLLALLVDHDAPAYRARLAELLSAPPSIPPGLIETSDFAGPAPSSSNHDPDSRHRSRQREASR
ncbi:helix-turn-helix transcriptional regulator [Tepidimonas taiwanensis]|uniref:helix-turn-helix domain-containing protein n=1 Tax=Tepidimonas taiwanensis TaxID=307486 RepID=UPI00117FB0CA|nr:helix-turn-helix transcriptional regulator [Tepidimonas taiwanensis]UBQ04479.1 helix-turn-helix transcriptional regulator [Tepidimonas taiwanensis]